MNNPTKEYSILEKKKYGIFLGWILATPVILYYVYCSFFAQPGELIRLSPLIVVGIIYTGVCLTKFDWGLYLLVFFIPFQFKGSDIGYGILSITDVMIICLSTVWVLRKILHGKFDLAAIRDMRFLLIFVIFCILSLKNVFDLKNSVEYLLRFLTSLAVFFILCDQINKSNQLINILKSLVFSSLFVCIFGLWQFFIINVELPLIVDGRLNNFRRILSTFNQPNETAAYLVVVIPLVIFFIRNSMNIFTTIKYAFIWFLNFICLTLTFSRAGFLCFLLSLFFLFKKKYIIILSLVIIPSFFLSGFFNFLGRSASTERRYQRYMAGIQFVINKPFFGHGFRDYKNLYLDYELREDLQKRSAHSLYLNILVETGLIGFISFAAFVLLTLKKVALPIRKLKIGRNRNSDIKNLSMSIFSSFVALLSIKFFSTGLTSLLMWTMFAVYQRWPSVCNSGKGRDKLLKCCAK